jgi:hypothetical protein
MKLVPFVLKNKEKGVEKKEGEEAARNLSAKLSSGCCTSAMTATASNTTATRIDGTAVLFIAHLVSSVIYHADRNKGKCDFTRLRRQGLVEGETRFFAYELRFWVDKARILR